MQESFFIPSGNGPEFQRFFRFWRMVLIFLGGVNFGIMPLRGSLTTTEIVLGSPARTGNDVTIGLS